MASCKGSYKVFQGTVPPKPSSGTQYPLRGCIPPFREEVHVKKDPGAAGSSAAKAHYGLYVT